MFKRPAFFLIMLCAVFLTSPLGEIANGPHSGKTSIHYFNTVSDSVIDVAPQEETRRRGRDPNLVLVACIPSPVHDGICLAAPEPKLSRAIRVLGACIASPVFDIGHCGPETLQTVSVELPPVELFDPTTMVPQPVEFALVYPVQPATPSVLVSTPTSTPIPGDTPLPADPQYPDTYTPYVPPIETGGTPDPSPPTIGRPDVTPPVTPVPLPAPGLMLVAALGCLALKRARKHQS